MDKAAQVRWGSRVAGAFNTISVILSSVSLAPAYNGYQMPME